jgi:O-antigen ligase
VAVFLGGVVLIARLGHARAAVATVGTALLAIGALVAAGLFGSLADGLRRTADDPLANILAANGRSEIWAPILEVAGDRLFLGYALGSDRQLMLELFGTGRIDWPAEHAHSLILHLVLVLGLPGLLLLLGSVGSAAPHLVRSTRLTATVLVVVMVGGVSEATVSSPEVAWAAITAGLASTLLIPRPSAASSSRLAYAECSRPRTLPMTFETGADA